MYGKAAIQWEQTTFKEPGHASETEEEAIRAEIVLLIARLDALQEGLDTRSRQKELAITKLEEAFHWLCDELCNDL